MSDWKPISSAPKDGTEILCFEPENGYIRVLSFSNNNWNDGDTWDDLNPSHWIALPAPPEMEISDA